MTRKTFVGVQYRCNFAGECFWSVIGWMHRWGTHKYGRLTVCSKFWRKKILPIKNTIWSKAIFQIWRRDKDCFRHAQSDKSSSLLDLSYKKCSTEFFKLKLKCELLTWKHMKILNYLTKESIQSNLKYSKTVKVVCK